MTTAIETKAHYTPEDLLAMPDGKSYELVGGQLVERNMGRNPVGLADGCSCGLAGFARTTRSVGPFLPTTAISVLLTLRASSANLMCRSSGIAVFQARRCPRAGLKYRPTSRSRWFLQTTRFTTSRISWKTIRKRECLWYGSSIRIRGQ